jgi:hypothetical protein
MSGEPSQPHRPTKGHNAIRGGSGKVLYDSKDDVFKSSSTIYSPTGKVLWMNKDEDESREQ